VHKYNLITDKQNSPFLKYFVIISHLVKLYDYG